jgi:hypothetical protein
MQTSPTFCFKISNRLSEQIPLFPTLVLLGLRSFNSKNNLSEVVVLIEKKHINMI